MKSRSLVLKVVFTAISGALGCVQVHSQLPGTLNDSSNRSESTNANSAIPAEDAESYKKPNLPKVECSYGHTNSDCYLLIDRNDPMSPVTMQLYSGSQVTIIVINPRIYERYTLDPTYPPAQAVNGTDVGNTVLSGIFQGIQKFGGLEQARANYQLRNEEVTHATSPCPATIKFSSDNSADECFMFLENNALSIYKRLVYCETPDAIGRDDESPEPASCTQIVANYDKDGKTGLSGDIRSFLHDEANLSAAISAYSKKSESAPPLEREIATQLSMKITDYDSLAKDLYAYDKRLSDLKHRQSFRSVCELSLSARIKTKAGCNISDEGDPNAPRYLLVRSTKDSSIYSASVGRPATFQLNALNLVTNTEATSIDPKKENALATVNLSFADSRRWFGGNTFRWEGSAGVFFSAIPDRSFAASPLYYQSGASIADPKNCPAASTQNPIGTVCDNIVTQTLLRPSIVPFTALNYRVSPDAPFIPWKSALYITGAVGYNVNTSSADFAGGLSINWRSIMISPLWHFGHDVELTNGLYLNESLGAGFKGNLTTQNYWRNKFAVGVSLRTSALTGR